MQTNLKSDDFCGYNIAAAPFYWTFMPDQYENTYATGEIGVNANGGAAGSYVRPDVIDISSFLSGRDSINTKCLPPVPSLDSLNMEPLHIQTDPELLIPKYTKQPRSGNDLSSINFDRYAPLYSDPQNPRYVIEDMWPQRGGLDTKNFTKSAWSGNNNSYNGFSEQDPELCRLTLDPSRACGPDCEGINGYTQKYMNPGKPPGQLNYPFTDITSQQVANVGAASCGPQFFYGPQLEKGNCPMVKSNVLQNNTQEFNYDSY